MSKSRLAVVDSNIAVNILLNTPLSAQVEALWRKFQRDQTRVLAPQLWRYEITSAIHKYLSDGKLQADQAEEILRIMFDLGVNLINEDEDLCLSAFEWASRLNQKAAYDGFYLALAERMSADFWTTDQHLANSARQAGAARIFCLTEKNTR